MNVKFDDQYLETFFAEKDLSERFYTVESEGTVHTIPTGVVLEHIALTCGDELEKIKAIIREIDYHNGDLHHFFEHLARAIAEKPSFLRKEI